MSDTTAPAPADADGGHTDDELTYDDLFKGMGGLDDVLASHEGLAGDGNGDDDDRLRVTYQDEEELSYSDLFKGESGLDNVLSSAGDHDDNDPDSGCDDPNSSSSSRQRRGRRRSVSTSQSVSTTRSSSTVGVDMTKPTSPRASSVSMFARLPHKSRLLKRSTNSEHKLRNIDSSTSPPTFSRRPSTTGRFRRNRESDYLEEGDASSSKHRFSKSPKSLPSKINMSSEERMAQFIGRHRPRKSIFLRRKSSGLKQHNLGYQTAPLSTPILNRVVNKSKSNASLSLTNFRYVQEFMDVVTEKSRRDDLGALIVTLGLQKEHLRDEIVLQIYKQTTKNPNEKSTLLGWKLLTMCLSTWPPSTDFDDLLRDFCRTKVHKEKNKEVVFLLELSNWMLSTWIADKRSPLTRVELDHLDDFGASFYSPAKFAYHSSLCFQLDAAERHHDIVDGIPPILHKLCASVLDLGGRDAQGIFRVAASRSVMMETRDAIEKNLRDARIPTPHVAADLLKHWLRSLSRPLVPAARHDELLDASRADASPAECMALVEAAALPPAFVVLKYLLEFFGELSKFEETTSMNASNFAIILAPSIIVITDIDVAVVMEKSPLASKFVEKLILFCRDSS